MKSHSHNLIPFLPLLLGHSTVISRDSLNYFSDGQESSLYILGADPTEHTASIVIAKQYLDCCLLILCSVNVFTEPLPGNEHLPWLRYSDFQAARHNIRIFISSSNVLQDLKMVYSLTVFLTKFYMHLSSLSCALHFSTTSSP
jgi:hypothetical protein